MEFVFILEHIRIRVAKYFEIWSLYVYRMQPHVPSLMTPPPSLRNRVQNKHVKIFHRFRVLYLCTFQRVLKSHWDSRRLDWTGLGRCEHPLTLESDWTGSDWTGLDSTRLCWCVRTIKLIRHHIPVKIEGKNCQRRSETAVDEREVSMKL